MKSSFFLAFFCLGATAGAGSFPIHRVPISPLDFQDEDNFLTETMSDLVFDGSHLFILSRKRPEFYQLTPTGEVVKVLGHLGDGPGELSGPPIGLAVDKGRLCVISPNGTAQIYFDGKFKQQFRLDAYLNHPRKGSANGLAFFGPYVVIPSGGANNTLAIAYHLKNPDTRIPLGSTAEIDRQALNSNRLMADTTWCSDSGFLYCAFNYFPLILKFDLSLKLVERFPITVPQIMDDYQAILEFEPIPKRQTHANPLIKDLKVTESYLYLFSGLFLYRLDKKTGEVLAGYCFYGKGPEFEDLPPEHRLNLVFFSPIDDRNMVLAHMARLRGHDLWRVELPE